MDRISRSRPVTLTWFLGISSRVGFSLPPLQKGRLKPTLLGILWLSWLCSISGCATMGVKDGKPLVPTAFQIRTGPYVICTNDKLETDAPVVRQLQALEGQLQETLGLKVVVGENPVEVYILDDRRAFDHFLTFYYPELPHRRAFFLANGPQRVVYTFFGDRLEEDIRHEATHALLHVAIGDVPLWLDEGLAEFFESPTERRGINPEHLSRLPGDLAAGWAPDLARLESLQSVRQMQPRDYRESWAWVHYLLNEGKAEKTALLAYLADLRTSADARPISSRLESDASVPLLAHLTRLRETPIALDAPKDPTVRLQSAPVEPTPTPKRRGVLGRIRDLFGP
jgi:Protein of unknown function (DUF1570)